VARQKEFDRDDVLERAMRLFWTQGYEATSMGDLTEHLGIGRQSLYDTFGDKHQLYLAALDRYRQKFGGNVPAALAGDTPVRRAIRDVFEGTLSAGVAEGGRGCMMVCATVERCPSDGDVLKRTTDNASGLERAFHDRLLRARRDGEIGPHQDPTALARYLTNALFGLGVSAKLGRSKEELRAVIDVTLSVLGLSFLPHRFSKRLRSGEAVSFRASYSGPIVP
jgi:TetR/AcrR family transcriptional repressor of nem operon